MQTVPPEAADVVRNLSVLLCLRDHLTRLNDAGLRKRRTKMLYTNHRLPPWLTEDDTRDRSNPLLECAF